MKSTTRGTLAAVLLAAAAGAAAATPAAAADTVPVPVPLEGAETALGMELPKLGGEVPIPMPGAPDGPRYVEGRLVPAGTLPQLPVTTPLPGLGLRTPLPRLLGDEFDHVGVDAPANDVRALGPGATLDLPLTPPNPDNFGLPDPKLPAAGIVTPVLQGTPAAALGLGEGL